MAQEELLDAYRVMRTLRAFEPALSEVDMMVADTATFRRTVEIAY